MRNFFTALIILLTALFLVAPAQAEWRDMWAYVYTWDGDMNAQGEMELTRVTGAYVTFKVLRADSDTSETLYEFADDAMTSLTNPVTAANYDSATVCNDRVAFRVDPTDSSDTDVDVIVTLLNGGFSVFVEDFTDQIHSIVVDTRPNIMHSGTIWYVDTVNTEVDTGIDFLYDTRIINVQPEIVNTIAGGTIDIGLLSSGTNGDADGLIDGASIATAGYPLTTLTTSGALMDNGTNFDPDGHVVLSANEASLTYTTSSASSTANPGYIHYEFIRLR